MASAARAELHLLTERGREVSYIYVCEKEKWEHWKWTRALRGKMTQEAGREKLLWCEESYNDDIEQYGRFFEDEATKKEVSRLKAERAEKNINAIRAMGIEV